MNSIVPFPFARGCWLSETGMLVLHNGVGVLHVRSVTLIEDKKISRGPSECLRRFRELGPLRLYAYGDSYFPLHTSDFTFTPAFDSAFGCDHFTVTLQFEATRLDNQLGSIPRTLQGVMRRFLVLEPIQRLVDVKAWAVLCIANRIPEDVWLQHMASLLADFRL